MEDREAIPFEPHKLARQTDVDTSHDAAESIKASRETQHSEILRAMKSAGFPLTAENIGDILGYPVWRRMTELEEACLILRTDIKRRNRSGRQAYCYEIKTGKQGDLFP